MMLMCLFLQIFKPSNRFFETITLAYIGFIYITIYINFIILLLLIIYFYILLASLHSLLTSNEV